MDITFTIITVNQYKLSDTSLSIKALKVYIDKDVPEIDIDYA